MFKYEWFWFFARLIRISSSPIKYLEKDNSKNRTMFHILRHTFASHLAINQTPVFTIKANESLYQSSTS